MRLAIFVLRWTYAASRAHLLQGVRSSPALFPTHTDMTGANQEQVRRLRAPDETSDHKVLSIGALSRATGIPVETLRTWERRYGFPAPHTRSQGGHRLYSPTIIRRLELLQQAITRQGGTHPRVVHRRQHRLAGARG